MKGQKIFTYTITPPFSTGEARMIRGTSRREIRGNLAQRALKKMIPQDNPYTVRIVSDILESNGSSSMQQFVQASTNGRWNKD